MTYVKSGILPNGLWLSKGISLREGETNWGPSVEDTDESSWGNERGQILGFCKYIMWFGFEVSKFAGTGSWYGRSVLKHLSLSLSLYISIYIHSMSKTLDPSWKFSCQFNVQPGCFAASYNWILPVVEELLDNTFFQDLRERRDHFQWLWSHSI